MVAKAKALNAIRAYLISEAKPKSLGEIKEHLSTATGYGMSMPELRSLMKRHREEFPVAKAGVKMERPTGSYLTDLYYLPP